MRRLVLLRHAKAVRPEPGLGDFDRGLEPRGRVEAARAARLLNDLHLAPDLVLLSPSLRTRETWAEMADLLPAGAVELDCELYDAACGTLLDRIAAHARADTLMIVGHNPGLREAAHALMSDGPHDARAAASLARGLPTACAVVLGIDGAPALRSARLAAFVAPERDDET
jgi:phosphohistidine phosphatase